MIARELLAGTDTNTVAVSSATERGTALWLLFVRRLRRGNCKAGGACVD